MGHREGVFGGYTRDPGGTDLLWGNPPLLRQKGIAAGYQTGRTLFKRGRESLFRKGWCKVVKSIDTFGCECKQAKHYERSDKTGIMIRGGFVYLLAPGGRLPTAEHGD